jgi:predicted DsbA family dithiol-disulfide isomerase
VEWVFFPLHPETPTEGRLLEAIFRGRGIDLDAAHQRMKRLMDGEGLPYEPRAHTYNSRLAQELAKWADDVFPDESIHDRIYRAYFVDGKNIGEVEVLVDLAASAGLPEDVARQVLEQREWKAAVDVDWERSTGAGVTGVPTFVAGGQEVVGAQSEPVLRQLLHAAGAVVRSQ